MTVSDEADLHAVAAAVRTFLEPRWRSWKTERIPWVLEGVARPLSENMCRFSALFLAHVLEREVGGTWHVDGGCSEPPDRADLLDVDPERAPGGMADIEGGWRGHYWVVDDGWSTILDITADQFGWPPVLITDAEDRRYRANYREAALEEHLRHVTARVENWLEDWREHQRSAMPGL